MKSRKFMVALLVTLLLAVAVSACSQPNLSEAKQQFCASLNKVNDAAQRLAAVDENTSIDEVKQAKEDLAQAWEELAQTSQILKSVQLAASETAYKDIVKAVDENISGETTLGDSAKIIATGAQKLEAQLKVINTTICGVK